MSVYLLSLVLIGLALASNQHLVPDAYAVVTTDSSAYGNNQGAYGGSPGNPLTFSLTHGANVLVVVSLSLNEHVGGTNVTSVTVGAASATLLRSVCASSTAYCTMMWYVFLSSSGTETVTVTENSAGDGALAAVAVSFAGARRSAPFFEDTGTDTGYCGAHCNASISVASGTSGRRVIMGVSHTQVQFHDYTWGAGQTLWDEAYILYSDWYAVAYDDTSGAVTMTCYMHDTVAYYVSAIATAILPYIPQYLLNLKVVQFDGSTVLSGASVTMNNGTDWVKTVSGGWANYTSISTATVTVKVKWENSWVNGTFTETMGANRTVTVVTKVYSSYALAWRFNDNSTAFTPTQIQLLAPNSTLVTLTGGSVSSLALVQNGTWTVRQVSKWGNNVVAASNPTFTPTGDSQTRQMSCRIYTVTPVWKDNSGASLYAAISSYKITYPNSTLSGTLSSGTAYWIQNGTSTISAVTWKGTDVTPASATFSAESGSPTFNLKIYALNLKHQDNLSNLLTVGVQLTFPNSTTLTKTPSSGWTNMTQVQTGTITIVTPTTVSGTERYVLTSSSTISLTSSTTQTETWRHDYQNVVFSFKDNSGGTVLAPQPSSFTVQLSNGTSTSNPTSSYWICTGTTTLTAVTWEGTNVLPTGSPSVSVTAQTTYYYNVYVYSTTPVWKDSSGAALYAAISSYKITFPNSTLSGALSSGTAYLIQKGTSTTSAVTWKGTDVTSASATFDASSGSPTFNLKVYALHIKNQDNLAISLTQDVQLTFPNSTATAFTPSSGWIDLLQVQTGTVTITTPITVSATERYVLTNSSTISLTSSTTTTEVWRHDLKSVVLQAKDGTGTTILSPLMTSFTVQLSNGTSIANPTSSTWMATGTTTLTVATWEGSNVCNSATVSITAQTTYYFNVAVYSRSLTFRYNDGATTFTPTQAQFTAPNSTLITLTSYSSVLLQNGTSTITSISYWGNNVVPAVHPTFDVSTGNVWIDTRIYSITPVWKANDGSVLYKAITSYKWTAPNSTLSGALSSGSAYWLQNGTSTVSAVTWQGSNVTPSAGMTFDATTGSPTENLRIYAFTMQGKDQSNNNLNVTFRITFSNTTVISFDGNSTGYYSISQTQNGTYSLDLLWKSLVVNSSVSQSITADTSLTFKGRVYYTATNNFLMAVDSGTVGSISATVDALTLTPSVAAGSHTVKIYVGTKGVPRTVYVDNAAKTLNTDWFYDVATATVSMTLSFSTHLVDVSWAPPTSGGSTTGAGGGGGLTILPGITIPSAEQVIAAVKGNQWLLGVMIIGAVFAGAGVSYQQDRRRLATILLGMGAVFTLNMLFVWAILPQQVLATNLGGLLPTTLDTYLIRPPPLEVPTVAPSGEVIATTIMTLGLLGLPIVLLAYALVRE